ncbi:MAG: Ig-like domain-containing protein, partial [Nitrosopumilaceae archaeon]
EPSVEPTLPISETGESCIIDHSNSSKDELARLARESSVNLLQLNSLYKQSSNEKQKNLDKMICVANERQQILISLVKKFEDPSEALSVSFSRDIKNGFPAEAQQYIEEEKTVSGSLDVIHSDDFSLGISKFFYLLNSDQGSKIELHFSDKKPVILTGSKVVAKGMAISNNIVAVSKDQNSFEVTSTPALEASMSMKKVAVILFNWQNNPVQPYTKDYAKGVTFTNTGSTNNYYQEISFNKVGFIGHLFPDGDVFGWYTVPYDSANCPWSSGSASAKSLASADGFNANNYDKVVFAFPSTSGCPGWGWAYIGGPESWVQGSYQNRVVGHELGHNYGTHHSNSYRCTDSSGVPVVISQTCTTSEYGDPFDIMGSSTNHMNNFQKGRIGYYDPANTVTVTTDGTYTIDDIETSSTGVQVIRIPKDYDANGNVLKYYYLEYRQPYGFDNFSPSSQVVNGISIRIAPPYTTVTQTQLLDSTPNTSTFGDATFLTGTIFEDPINGVIVRPLSNSATSATVEIQFGPGTCIRSSPTMSMSPSTQWGYAGNTLPYSLTITNRDSIACGPSNFTVNSSLPSGWSQTPLVPSVTLSPGASSTVQVQITSSPSAAPEFYTLYETVVNTSDTAYQATSSAIYNVRLPDTTPPTVTITSPSNGSIVPKGSLKINASASDSESGIAKIQILVGGAVKKTCNNTNTCQYTWKTSGVAPGTYLITAIATDKAPAANSNSVSISVTKL